MNNFSLSSSRGLSQDGRERMKCHSQPSLRLRYATVLTKRVLRIRSTFCGMFHWSVSGGSVYESCTTFRVIHKPVREGVSSIGYQLQKINCAKKVRQENDHRKRRANCFCWNVILRSISGNRFYVLFLADPRESAHENGQRPSLRRKLEFNGAAVGILMNFSNVSRVEFHFRRSKHDERRQLNDSIQNRICRFSIRSALPRCRRNRFDVR